MQELLVDLAVSRITLRARADGSFPVIAEVVKPGVARIGGAKTLDPRKGATLQWILEHRATLVQDDCERAELAPPKKLLALYQVKSQIVTPVTDRDEVIGCVSVHSEDLRRWRSGEVRAAERVAERAIDECR